MARVELSDIRKTFGSTEVLKGIDLRIADGEFISLVGPSGCGKSTLLRIIAGLEPQGSGHVAIGGEVVDRMRPNQRNIAMVFQSYALYPHLSVYDNIAVPLRMRRLNVLQRMALLRWLVPGTRDAEQEIGEAVTRIADLLGMQDLLHRKPGQLSGGQRQRVAVGRAIIRQPKAFLLDEPLSNLDAKLRVHMRAEIAQLHRDLGATFVYVTHDQAEAMTMSDRIAVMMNGELVQVGTPDEVYDEPQDLRVAEFIGSPKINVLPAHTDGDGEVALFGRRLGHRAPVRHSEIDICFRPEAAALSDSGGAGQGIEGRVVYLENLGAEVFVHIGIDGVTDPVIIRQGHGAAQRFSPGTAIQVGVDTSQIKLFDATGRRVSTTMERSLEMAHG